MSPSRYTRLKAIKEFGYNIDWKELRKYHIGIIGVGGLGAVSSEMAARCGVGTISLFDFDTVEVVNLNRHMFKEKHIGRPKVDVAREVLQEINPDVKFQTFNHDIMDIRFESTFEKEISQMDLLLNGLDNIPAREYLNLKCIHLNVPYIDAGASRSGLSGHVHPIIPFKTACAKCLSRIQMAIPKVRGEPCVASLPSTMAILASIQTQEMLKHLLKFGKLIDYIMYDMVSGRFLTYKTKRDPDCPACGAKAAKKGKKRRSNADQIDTTDNDLSELIDKFKKGEDED